MLKSLLKINFAAYGKMFAGKKGNKPSKGKILLYAVLFAYVFGIFVWTYYQLFEEFAPILHNMGYGWLYFVYVDIMAFAMMCIFSVFASKTTLYEAKDNDLLLSLPIKPSVILLSRMTTLLIINLFFGLLVLIPAGMAWYRQIAFSPMALVSFVLIALCLSLFALAISSLFGWLLAAVSARVRRKSLFETVLSVIFLGAYFVFFAKLNGILNDLIRNAADIADSMSSFALLKWIGDASTDGDAPSLLLSVLCLALPFAAVYAILSASFIKTATTKRGAAKVKYVDKGQKVSSPMNALRKKEWSLFLSNSTYIINCGLGALFILAAGIALLIYREDLLLLTTMLQHADPIYGNIMLPICMLALGLLGSVSVPSIAAISLEGRSIWIIQTVPVKPQSVLRAKVEVSLWLYMLPLALCVVAVLLCFESELLLAVLSALFPLLILPLFCVMSLTLNLRHYNLNWRNPAEPIKRDAAVIIGMLCNFGIVIAFGGGGWLLFYYANLGIVAIMAIFDAVLVIAVALLWRYLMHGGAARLLHLS